MSPEMDTSLCSGEFNIFKNVNFLDSEEAALHLRRRKHIEVYKMHLKGSCLWLITFVIVALSVGESVNVTNYDYDHFVYAQRWPQSVCACSEGRCRIPEEVKTWTVHGLWPTLGDSDKPTECNRSWTFEEEKILDIETQLEKYWTSLEDNGENSRISFWKHEWKKHGICCTDLTYLDSEHKYFSIGLQLNQKYDLLSILNESNIVPSRSRLYKLDDIREAVRSKLGYSPMFICCSKHKKERVQEILICLDKKLKLIDCHQADEQCKKHTLVHYEPLNPYP